MDRPPPSIGNTHVIEFAITDDTVKFEQRYVLNVGGDWLGEVSNIAICQDFNKIEFMVFHCNREWDVLGVAAGFESIDAAKEKIELSYHGIATKWEPSGFSREEAATYSKNIFKDQSCSFCGRTPLEFQAVAGDAVRICNYCVDTFYEEMHKIKPRT